MALIVEPYKLLKIIGKHPAEFAAIKTDALKAGQKLFEKQIKHKSTTLETLCTIYDAFGDGDFKIMADGLEKLGSTIKRLDGHHPDLKAMTARDHRTHLVALAARKAVPTYKPEKKTKAKVPKPTKAPKTAKTTKPKPKKADADFMNSESLRVRDRERE